MGESGKFHNKEKWVSMRRGHVGLTQKTSYPKVLNVLAIIRASNMIIKTRFILRITNFESTY